MNLITYDCEVFKNNWLVCFKDYKTKTYTCVWDDNEALKACISDDNIYIGFNNKHYDQHIVKGIRAGFSAEQVKGVNDYIIAGGQGWDCVELRDVRLWMNNVDVMDDMQMGLSLKAIEGHLGYSIVESDVSFDVDRPLTEEEKKQVEAYCKTDVDNTEKIFDLRADYFKNKVQIGKLAGIPEQKAMGMTNAKLTAALLKAERKDFDDERQYVYPENLKREYIPKEVFEFFDRMHDPNVQDDELFKSKLELVIGDCPVTIGFGGIHGAIPNATYDLHENERYLFNYDVASYYPHLMTICGYTSRAIPSAKIYEDILEQRIKAKAEGNKAIANALKLVLNTTYGAMLNKYNALYDPLMGRSVCITGQLFLLELAEHLYKDIENLKIFQLNTDGIMIEFDSDYEDEVEAICKEWQARTKFELERDIIDSIYQKDVNNYIEVQINDDVKIKGGYLVRGISTVGSFNVNNNACIVSKAIIDYFVEGLQPEDTINKCTELFQFQLIAKVGSKYARGYQLVDGEEIKIQNVNRVYATSDERYGTLYKVKKENGSVAKIENLPEHCIIDNDNKLSVEDIDKTYYIKLAQKRIDDFKGIKPETKRRSKMATTKTATNKNVYQKLIEAREQFMSQNVQKSGKNMHLSFKYFELDDIVPVATKIFSSIGLIGIDNFTQEVATMSIINTDNPEEVITFTAPFNQISPIISSTGKQATNEMQALGSSITYMRRYLYMIALDICEPDSIDAEIGKPIPAPTAPVEKKAPVTAEERKEVKKELTAPSEQASELQIKGLKTSLAKLKQSGINCEKWIAELAVKTKGFTLISKSDCEALIEKVTKKLEEKKEEVNEQN